MGQITIADVRAKFPQYDQMSDGQLADAIHQKYYPDMERGAFNNSIGYDAAPTVDTRPQARPQVDPQASIDSFVEQAMNLEMPTPPRDPRVAPIQPEMLARPSGMPQVGNPQGETPASTINAAQPQIKPSMEQLAKPLFNMMGGASSGMVDQAKDQARQLAIKERAQMMTAPQTPAAVDPFAGEGGGALLKRRGQEFTQGFSGVIQSLAQSRSINAAQLDRAIREQAPEQVKEFARQSDVFEKMLQSGVSPMSGQPMQPEERATIESRLADAQTGLASWTDQQEFGVMAAEDRSGYKTADKIDQFTKDTFGEAPQDGGLWSQLANGAGSMGAFMLPSVLGPLGLAGTAQMGADAARSEAYTRAKGAGASNSDAEQAAMFAGFMGTSEAVPIASALKFLPAPIRGKITGRLGRIISDIAVNAGEEAAQEAMAAIGQNLIAQKIYDPDQKIITKDVAEQALIGAILGGGIGGAASIASGRKKDEPEQTPNAGPAPFIDTSAPKQPLSGQPQQEPVVQPTSPNEADINRQAPKPIDPVDELAQQMQDQAPTVPVASQSAPAKPVGQDTSTPLPSVGEGVQSDPASEARTDQIKPDDWQAVPGMKAGQPTGRTWMTNGETGETISKQEYDTRLQAQPKASPEGGGNDAPIQGATNEPTIPKPTPVEPVSSVVPASDDAGADSPVRGAVDGDSVQGTVADEPGTSDAAKTVGDKPSGAAPVQGDPASEVDAGATRAPADAGVDTGKEGAAVDPAALAARLEGNETEARKQGRKDFESGAQRVLPPYIDATDDVAARAWYTGFDEAILSKPVDGVMDGAPMPTLPDRDQRSEWDAMTPDQRRDLMGKMDGTKTRDGSLNKTAQKASEKAWNNISAPAREKIMERWDALGDSGDAVPKSDNQADNSDIAPSIPETDTKTPDLPKSGAAADPAFKAAQDSGKLQVVSVTGKSEAKPKSDRTFKEAGSAWDAMTEPQRDEFLLSVNPNGDAALRQKYAMRKWDEISQRIQSTITEKLPDSAFDKTPDRWANAKEITQAEWDAKPNDYKTTDEQGRKTWSEWRDGSGTVSVPVSVKAEKPKRKRIPKPRQMSVKRPLLQALTSAGVRVDPNSQAAGDLRNMGVTSQTAPGFFKIGGMKDLDNIVASEFPEFFGLIEEDGYYFDLDDLKNAIGEEVSGSPRLPAEAQELLADQDYKDRVNEIRTAFDNYASDRGITAFSPQERIMVIDRLVDNDSSDDLSIDEAIDFVYMTSAEGMSDYDAGNYDSYESYTGQQANDTQGAEEQGADGEAGRTDTQFEETDAGQQALTEGVAPVTDKDRAETKMNAPKQGGSSPMPGGRSGLFGDPDERGDLFDGSNDAPTTTRDLTVAGRRWGGMINGQRRALEETAGVAKSDSRATANWDMQPQERKVLLANAMPDIYFSGAAPSAKEVTVAASEADTNPTDAQKEAGNYKMGHQTWNGLDITIENAKGSVRSKTNAATGKSWSVTMPAHYGYIKRTEGADGDHVDVYLGPNMDSDRVFIIDQVHLDRKFDEHKVMIGFVGNLPARQTHSKAFSDGSGEQRRGGVTEMTVAEFKDWLANGDTSKPLSETLKADMAAKKEATQDAPPQSNRDEGNEATQADNGTDDNADQPTVRLAEKLSTMMQRDDFPSTNMQLMKMAADYFGGTIAEGAFSPKDAYEALELAMNLYAVDSIDGSNGLSTFDPRLNAETAKKRVKGLQHVLDTFPTQTRRDTETDAFQQFSTPPTYGYAVNWIANIQEGERVLEPSAGNGGIAVFAKNAGAKVDVNELAERRVPSLKALAFDRVTTENAEQIANIWANDASRSYDAVVMNPPFSASGDRGTKNTSATGAKHVEQALSMLKDGGRLVAIMGHTFQPGNSRVAPFFKRLEAGGYSLRANVVVKGDQVYKKYGTTYDNRLLVIDKVPPAKGSETLKGEVATIPELIDMMEGIRDEASNRRTKDDASTADAGNTDRAGSRTADADGGQSRDGKPQRVSKSDDLGGTASQSGRDGRSSGKDGNADGAAKSVEGTDGKRKSSSNDAGNGANRSSGATATDSTKPTVRVDKAERSDVEETSGGFAKYRPTRVRINGAKEHPIALVESSAMATVTPPMPNYELKLPSKMVKDGLISEAQLEQVLYAGAAHSEMLQAEPDQAPRRKGYYIGDGTGVGKTREIAGIIADNWAQGRKKHILISKDKKLLTGARRDFDNVGMKSVPISDLGKVKSDGEVPKDANGVLFATYSTIGKSPAVDKKSRLEQIIEWVGPDFDGTITFDEAHLAGNALPIKGKRGTSKPSATALAVVEMQKLLPNARVVYASATAATEVYNLAYADRLGLWGPGTAFPTVESFVTQIDKGGVAAMEVVARDMKQMGVYMARSISFDGVEYGKVEHELTTDQREMYDAAAVGWQTVLANVQKVIQDHTEGGGRQRGAALAQFWGAHQRFFQQVLTSMQMPTVLSNIEADLKAGMSPVIQIVNTNEAATKRAMSKMEEGDSLDDIDITPREDLIQYLETSFPVHQFETYMDDNGNERQRPVEDANGDFVKNKEAVRIRDELVGKLGAMTLPGNPLDMMINKFGSDKVAEITGRSTRIVEKNGKRVQERRSQSKTLAEAAEFQGGKRDVLIFSDAGGTGMDFHADKGAKNTKRRAHYVLQAGWRADRAIQGFGRTHRTNQAQPPIYKLAGTNLSGHKRFTSSIARRLDQLGALTKGQKDASGSGMFNATDNLENEFADTAVEALFYEIWRGEIDGFTPADAERELGLNLVGEKGFNVSKIPPVTQFLNRLLNTTIDRQNMIFDRFIEHMETAVQQAIEDGQFTAGVEAISHDGAVLIDTKEAFRDNKTAATSHYQMVQLTKKVQVTPFVELDTSYATIRYKRDRNSGAVYGFRPASSRTNDRGQVVPTYHRYSPTDKSIVDGSDYQFRYEKVDPNEAETAWNEAIKDAPATREENLHIVTGALLPIWDRLPSTSPKIVRLQLDDGRSLLGRVIPDIELTSTLENLGVTGPEIDMSGAEIQASVLQGKTIILSSGHKFVRRRVGGEQRIEIIPPAADAYRDTMPGGNLQRLGFQIEKINYKSRAFAATSEKALPAIDAFMSGKNIVNVTMEREQTVNPQNPASTLGQRADNPTAKTNAEKPYAVWSKRDKRIVSYAGTKNGGRGAVDRWDIKHGSAVHRLIDNPFYQGLKKQQRVDQGPLQPYRETMAESRVFKMLHGELSKLGLGFVELQFDPFFEHQGKVYADHFGKVVITIGQTLNPRWTMNHEAIHVYKHMGLFSKTEWDVLSEEATSKWMERYQIEGRYPDLTLDEQIEEAVAEAFGEASEKNTGFKTSGPVRAALRQIHNFLKAIRNWSKGLGLKSPDDVLEAMARGEFAKRKDVKGWESQTARLMKQRRKPSGTERMRGGMYLPDRYIWDTLINGNGNIFARAKEAKGAAGDRFDLIRTRMQDRFLPVLRAQQVIERQMGAPVPEELNAYLAEEMYSGRAGYKLDKIDNDYTSKIIQIIGNTKGVTTETVGRFLYARHAAERNERIAEINQEMPDGGSGMGTDEADAILKEIRGSVQASAYEDIAEMIDKLREWTIQERVDMGLMTNDEATAWRKAYKAYVPLKGWAETDFSDAELDVTGIGRGYNVRGDETRRAMGRKTEAFNPMVAAITQAQEVAIRSEKNRVGQHLYRLAKTMPSKGLFEVKKVETARVFNESTGLVEERNMSPITMLQADNEMAVKVDGEEYRIIFNDHRLARAATRVGVDNLGALMRPLSMFSRYISTINTMLNPEFVLTNFARDTVTANVNIQSKELGSKIQKGMMKDLPKAMKGAYRGLGGKSDTEWSQYFQEFSEAGAKVSFWVMENPEANQKSINKRMKREANGAKGMALALVTPDTDLNPVLNAMNRINLAVDNAIRLAAFVHARKNGMTAQQAASLSKNLTVNFNRRGDYGSAINAAYVFANAAMQGTHIMFKALKSRRVQAIVTGMVLTSYLLDQANAYLSEEDEDGQLAYDKLPDYKQERSLVIMLGRDAGDAITLPMPYGYNVFTYMGNRLSKMQRGAITAEKAMGDTALAAFNSFSPISGGSFMGMITPTILDPALDIAVNEDWLGRSVYPDYPNMTGPDSQRFFGSVTDASRIAAEKANAWTGGTYAESGYADVSPETIDHIAGYLTGGTGRFFGRTTDLFAKIFQGKDVEINDIPIARTLYTDTGKWLDSSVYFDRRTEVREANAAVKSYTERGDPVPAHIQWKADLYKVQLQSEKYRRGTSKVAQDKDRAYLLLNTAYVKALKANTPYSSDSIFGTR